MAFLFASFGSQLHQVYWFIYCIKAYFGSAEYFSNINPLKAEIWYHKDQHPKSTRINTDT